MLKERRANNIKHAENRNVYVARRSIRRGVLSLEQENKTKARSFSEHFGVFAIHFTPAQMVNNIVNKSLRLIVLIFKRISTSKSAQ